EFGWIPRSALAPEPRFDRGWPARGSLTPAASPPDPGEVKQLRAVRVRLAVGALRARLVPGRVPRGAFPATGLAAASPCWLAPVPLRGRALAGREPLARHGSCSRARSLRDVGTTGFGLIPVRECVLRVPVAGHRGLRAGAVRRLRPIAGGRQTV